MFLKTIKKSLIYNFFRIDTFEIGKVLSKRLKSTAKGRLTFCRDVRSSKSVGNISIYTVNIYIYIFFLYAFDDLTLRRNFSHPG